MRNILHFLDLIVGKVKSIQVDLKEKLVLKEINYTHHFFAI